MYFVYHSFSGDRGVFEFIRLNSEYDELQRKVEFTRAQRLDLEHKVNLLQTSSLDLDLLAERVRAVLSYAKPSEDVLIVED